MHLPHAKSQRCGVAAIFVKYAGLEVLCHHHRNVPVLIEKLILASASPYRRELLKSTGVLFETVVSGVDESDITPPTPLMTAQQRAVAKATAVGGEHPTALVIGCDQVLELDGVLLSKATTAEQVREHLHLLQGRAHALHSAFCLYYHVHPSPLLHTQVVTARLHMRALTAAEIDGYVERGEWSTTVGCYRYEIAGVNLFASIEGTEDNIAALPRLPLLHNLRRCGINPLLQPDPPWHLPALPPAPSPV